MPSVKDYDALYYPYIHVRDAEWLKRSLLLFPRICRMVPAGFNPQDTPEIATYARLSGPRGPLLSRLDPTTGGTLHALAHLEAKFKHRIARNPKRMVKQFGVESADKLRKSANPYGFQYQVRKAPQLS